MPLEVLKIDRRAGAICFELLSHGVITSAQLKVFVKLGGSILLLPFEENSRQCVAFLEKQPLGPSAKRKGVKELRIVLRENPATAWPSLLRPLISGGYCAAHFPKTNSIH